MVTKNRKTDQIPSIRVDPEVFAKIESLRFGDSLAETVRRLLTAAVVDPANQADPAAEPVKTAAQLLKERKESAIVEQEEIKAAKLRNELLTVDQALEVVERDYGQIRSRAQALPQCDPTFTDEQREAIAQAVQDMFADLSGDSRETFDAIANGE